jgi:zinc protease
MTRRWGALALLACALPVHGWQAAAGKEPAAPPLGAIQSLPLKGIRMANGMRLYLIEDHELPVVFGIAIWRGGSALDPADEPGLARLTATLLRTGGSRGQTGGEIDAALESMGASISTADAPATASLAFSGLKENAVDLLRLVRDLLATPGFRLEKIELAKAQMKAGLRRHENIMGEARQEMSAEMFGRQTPYGRQENEAGISRIRAADVRGFYTRSCVPGGVALAVEGDFDAALLRAEIEKLFAGWTGAEAAELPPAKPAGAAGIYVGTGQDLSRAAFAMGQSGGNWRDPDSAVWAVLMNLLGGRNSRLRERVPSTAVNPAEIGASWEPGFGYPGTAAIVGETASFNFPHMVELVRADMERLRSAEVSEEELRAAKDAALETLALAGDSKFKRLARDLDFEFWGYPAGFAGQYQKALAAVTRTEVHRVTKERLEWGRFTVVAIGDTEALGRQLGGTGRPVMALETATPEKGAPENEDTEAARRMLQKAIAASGGAEKWAALRDATRTVSWEFSVQAGGGRALQTDRWVAPAFLRQETHGQQGPLSAYTDGKAGWISNGRGSVALSGTNFVRTRDDLFRFYPRLLLSGGMEGRMIRAVDDEAIEIREGELAAQVIFDAGTGLPAKVLYEGKTAAGAPVAFEEDLLDFREVAGVKLPFLVKILENGQEAAVMTTQEWKINQGLQLVDLLRRP